MDVPAISSPLLTFFRGIVRRYFRRHFHAVRLSNSSRLATVDGPLIIYANHTSWWDPMVSFLLAARLMPQRKHYAPMDASALERYGILKHLGIFPVELDTSRGAVQFLRTGQSILEAGGVLWVTPQGKFVDVRQRPLEFKPGLARLAIRAAASSGTCTLLPLAIEYPFWDERLPEALLNFGYTIQVSVTDKPDEIQLRLITALEGAMNELQALALKRNAAPFQTLQTGTLGTGGFYALGQRINAFLMNRPYRAEHTPIAAPREDDGTHA
jgi:1-acyl-sn-glycerol-3-phosphate acyltransferase